MNTASAQPVGTGPLVLRFPPRVVGAAHATTMRGLLIPTGVAAIALALRAWQLGAVFESSDEVAMAYLVRHSFGLKWIFAHDYGPALAVLQRGFAEVLSWLGLPIAETAARVPVMLVSLAQVAITFPLLRRMRCSRDEALLGMLCCAVLPMMAADAHYTWAYRAVWLLTGTTALWATLAWLDDRRWWQLSVAGGALFVHCLSNCYAFGLPLTLLVLWMVAGRKRQSGAAFAFVLPCVAALLLIGLSWWWTGQGQIGHLIAKHQAQTSSWHLHRLWQWAMLWWPQLGFAFAPIAAAGMLYGMVLLARPDRLAGRRGRLALLGLWAWAAVLPLVCLVDPTTIGHAGAYLIEAVYAAALLAVLLLCAARDRLAGRGYAQAGLSIVVTCALGLMAFGAADDCYAGGRWRWLTGVHIGWGHVRPDTGIKAAGWYVREHVPMDANVLAVHTNSGLEVTVAEYYLGRGVLAGYDLKPEMIEPLTNAMRDVVDVIVVGAEQRGLVDGLGEFDCVCTLTCDGQAVRFIYARPTLSLPRLDADVSAINRRYDRQYTPRHVPIPLPASPDFDAALERYQRTVRQLKQGR